MFNYCFKIAAKPTNKFIVNILNYSLFAISVFFTFLLNGKNSLALPSIYKFNRINLFLFYEIFSIVFAIYLFFHTGKDKYDKELLKSIDKLPVKKKKKYLFYLLTKLIPTVIATVLSLVLSILVYLIIFIIFKSIYGYGFRLSFLSCIMTIIIPILLSILSSLYSFFDYFDSELFGKYDILLFASAFLSLFLFIFINKSIIVFILFVISTTILSISLIYNFIYFYSASRRVNLVRRSSFIYLLIRRKNIAYYVLAITAMFINIVFIASNYTKFIESNEYYKYDYVIETENPNSYLEELITSADTSYNLISATNEFSLDSEKYNIYSLDLTKLSEFFDTKTLVNLSSMPQNAIILPKTIYNENNYVLGDVIELEISDTSYEFIVYGFINDTNGCSAYTNLNILSNTEYKYILVVDRQNNNKVNSDDVISKFDYNRSAYFASLLKFIAAIIIFISISILIITMYILERKDFDESIEYDKNKLISANLKTDEVFKTILSANYLMFILSFIALFVLLLLVSYYNTNYINIIFKVNYTYVDISRYFIYLLEIFAFFTIIIFVDYLIEKGKLDHEY